MLQFLKRIVVTGVLVTMVAALVTPSTVNARTLDEILASGTLKVGVNPALAPLGMYDEKNEIAGFDVDYSQKLADMLGVTLEVVQVGSPDRIPFVASGKIDIVMGAMTRNPERAKIIDFTLPVHTEVFGVLTLKENIVSDWKELDRPDVTFVQVRGSTPVKFIEENLPQAEVLLLDNYPDVVRALAQGRADAMLDVLDFVGEYMNTHDVEWSVVETPIDVYYCAIGVAKNSDNLKDWLNVAIFELQRKGVTDELWLNWFGIKMLQPVDQSPWF
jgi:polar amino acid transport system substrate-binding protein